MRFVEPEKLLSCVHCGLCLASCPTYVELGTEADSPRGRILLMRALEEGRLEPTAEVIGHLDGCLGCRACETACPSGVPYGSLIEAARPFLERHRPAPARLVRRALANVLARPALRALAFGPVRATAGALGAARLARLARRVRPRALARWIAYAAALPDGGDAEPIHAPTAAAMDLAAEVGPGGSPRGTAVLLVGCVADTLFSSVNGAIARLLQRAGVRVIVPAAQSCCGALALHLGDRDGAERRARDLLAQVADIEADWIVPSAAGCGALLRELDHLLPGDAAARVAARATDPLALLARLGLPPARHEVRRRVAIHDPCHLLHAQGVGPAVHQLLAAVPGLEIVPLAESDRCCGSAGTYNLTEPGMASRLLERKLDHVEASGADVIAAANPGCLLQIRSGGLLRGLAVEVQHPIEILARAQGIGIGSTGSS